MFAAIIAISGVILLVWQYSMTKHHDFHCSVFESLCVNVALCATFTIERNAFTNSRYCFTNSKQLKVFFCLYWFLLVQYWIGNDAAKSEQIVFCRYFDTFTQLQFTCSLLTTPSFNWKCRCICCAPFIVFHSFRNCVCIFARIHFFRFIIFFPCGIWFLLYTNDVYHWWDQFHCSIAILRCRSNKRLKVSIYNEKWCNFSGIHFPYSMIWYIQVVDLSLNVAWTLYIWFNFRTFHLWLSNEPSPSIYFVLKSRFHIIISFKCIFHEIPAQTISLLITFRRK